MKNIILRNIDKTIRSSFYLLFFLAPLILTPFNYELFEYNKMMAVYGLTVIIFFAWIIKTVVNKKIKFVRTPMDVPILFFFISQLISTIISLDIHVSIWGYYSRFNGGLLSLICYLILYYAFVSNFPKEKIKKLLSFTLTAGVLVCIYGVLQHFGIDKHLWVQDVQNRVFSTLGQPNWLAAYLAILTPLAIGFCLNCFSVPSLNTISENKNSKWKKQSDQKILPNKYDSRQLLFLFSFAVLFYLTIIFTKSRSGFLGFWTANAFFWMVFWKKFRRKIIGLLLAVNLSFLFLNFLFGAPLAQINRFSLSSFLEKKPVAFHTQQQTKNSGSSIIDVGITESAVIRKIVWKGAVQAFAHYPIFGTGVETFYLAYYLFRPQEHNMTSEWDFLYNKAHNEYLNFAATTGVFGIGSYLLFIISFIFWFWKKILYPKLYSLNPNSFPLSLGLFCGWISILVTNFFGFSVVVTQLFFYLLPAISFVLTADPIKITSAKTCFFIKESKNQKVIEGENSLEKIQIFLIFFFLTLSIYLLFSLIRLWQADVYFARGYNEARDQEFSASYNDLKEAISINANEPLYYDEFALPAAQLAVFFFDQKESSLSARLEQEAILASNIATSISPNNVNFWKTRTRIFYILSSISSQYLAEARLCLEKARSLSPTDPKISYNLALILAELEQKNEAIALLEETVKLKPDYKDAFLALGIFYQQEKNLVKAKEIYNYILERLNPNDQMVKEKLHQIK